MKYDGKWAQVILAQQQPDGLWGNFHTLAVPMKGVPLATEQAIRRLGILGYTAEDEPIARCLGYMRRVLRGEAAMPDRREKVHDWDLFTALMMSAWIRLFIPDDPDACAFGRRWAQVLAAAFAGGDYDDAAYKAAYTDVFRMPPKGARFIDFMNFYVIALVANLLDVETEKRFFAYVLAYPQGIYYIYEHAMLPQPVDFASRQASHYAAALALLARYRSEACRTMLLPCIAWVERCATSGKWDFGAKAKDGVYFPLSDSWRSVETRIADCSHRVKKLLERYRHG